MQSIQGILEFVDQIFVNLSFWFSSQLANYLPE